MTLPQRLEDMRWDAAPAWATHIVGWVGDPSCCFWAQRQGERYFCDETRAAGLISFWIVEPEAVVDRDDEPDSDIDFGWVVHGSRADALLNEDRS